MSIDLEAQATTEAYAANGHDPDHARATVNDGIPLDAEYATADDFFSSPTPPPSELYIPEWRKKVFVRVISGKERDAYEQSLVVGRGPNQTVNARNMRAKLAALALAKPDGSRMFRDADAGRLGDLPAGILERIFDRARKINGMTDGDADDDGAAGN